MELIFVPNYKAYNKYKIKLERQYSTDPSLPCKKSGPDKDEEAQSF